MKNNLCMLRYARHGNTDIKSYHMLYVLVNLVNTVKPSLEPLTTKSAALTTAVTSTTCTATTPTTTSSTTTVPLERNSLVCYSLTFLYFFKKKNQLYIFSYNTEEYHMYAYVCKFQLKHFFFAFG